MYADVLPLSYQMHHLGVDRTRVQVLILPLSTYLTLGQLPASLHLFRICGVGV